MGQFGAGVNIECSFRTTDRIRCDLNQLENALLNLAINARDAMPSGGRLDLQVDRCVIDDAFAENTMPPGSYVSISVTDSGTGISPEILSRIFDPFFTTKKLGEGTGLGLSMIYGFTQQSGGQVRVHSSLGVGTTVTLYFPVDDSQPEDPKVDLNDAQQLESSGQNEIILLVDDEAAIRQTALELLSETGYRVIEAVDSVSAINRRRSWSIWIYC